MRIGLVVATGRGRRPSRSCSQARTWPPCPLVGGTVSRSGTVANLPQDPRTGDLEQKARDRFSRHADHDVLRRIRRAEHEMATAQGRGGTGPWSVTSGSTRSSPRRAAGPPSRGRTDPRELGLPTRVLDQPVRTLSGACAPVELARILVSDADTLLLDEPTNHLDHDSVVWLGLPEDLPGGWWSSPTTSSCSALTVTTCSTSTPTAPSSTSTTSGGTTLPEGP
jgi:hypothetical protein